MFHLAHSKKWRISGVALQSLLRGGSGKPLQEVPESCASWTLCDHLSLAAAPAYVSGHGFLCNSVATVSYVQVIFFHIPCPSKVLRNDLGIKEAPTLLLLGIWDGPQVPRSDTQKTPSSSAHASVPPSIHPSAPKRSPRSPSL